MESYDGPGELENAFNNLDPDLRRLGLGRMLYEALEAKLKEMGIPNLYACIGYPETEDEYLNKNSARFHARLGFTKAGEFRQCGYKFGRWYFYDT